MPDLFYGLDSTLDLFSRGIEEATILDDVWREGGVIVDLDAKVRCFGELNSTMLHLFHILSISWKPLPGKGR